MLIRNIFREQLNTLSGAKIIASLVISAVLILQVTAGFLIKTGGRLYPFVAYPMYSQPTKGPDIALKRLVLTVFYKSGDSVRLNLRMRKRDKHEILDRLEAGDASAARAAGSRFGLIRRNDSVVRLRLDVENLLYSNSHLMSVSKKTETFDLPEN